MWTPQDLSVELEKNFVILEGQLDALGYVELRLSDAQDELIRVRDWHRLNDAPESLGKNEAQRVAAIAEKCKAEATVVANLERQRLEFRSDMERTRTRLEHLKLQIRLLEVTAGLQRAA